MRMLEYLTAIRIIRWNKKTFPDFTPVMQEQKMQGEIDEYFQALTDYHWSDDRKDYRHSREELADVIISAIGLLRHKRVLLAVIRKMKTNIKRKWNKGQHYE